MSKLEDEPSSSDLNNLAELPYLDRCDIEFEIGAIQHGLTSQEEYRLQAQEHGYRVVTDGGPPHVSWLGKIIVWAITRY